MITGTRKVFEDLTLKNFTWHIKGVSYDWINSKAIIQVGFKEEGSAIEEHSRNYQFDCNEVWTDQDAINAILKLEQFKA